MFFSPLVFSRFGFQGFFCVIYFVRVSSSFRGILRGAHRRHILQDHGLEILDFGVELIGFRASFDQILTEACRSPPETFRGT